MKKKSAKRHRTFKRAGKYSGEIVHIRYIFIGLIIFAVFFAGKMFVGMQKVRVLGTAVFIADHGSEDSASGTSGGDNSGGSSNSSVTANTSSNTSSNSSGGSSSSTSGGGTTSNAGSSLQTTNPDSAVDCVGPDGKHFTTSFHDCQELNQKWGNANFTFTSLSSSGNTDGGQNQQTEPTKPATHSFLQTPQGTIEVQTEGSKGELNLETPGMHVEMKREDSGKLTIKAKNENGTEVELKNDSLEKINEALSEKNVEVSTTSANGLAITSGDVRAETDFPLSLNPTTKSLSVTTPNGTTDINVLPDQAVQSILDSKILTSIESEAASAGGSSTSSAQTVQLTELNNEPVFSIKGVTQKRILGFIPVGFAKTAFVSAITGQITKVDETSLNKLLETISF